MKLLFILTCLLTFSCNAKQNEKAEHPKIYSDTSTLFYKRKPLFIFNESIDKLIIKPSFYQDTANRQGGGFSYTTIDTFFSARQSTGTLIGNIHIETNDFRQIQRVYGYWAVSVPINDKTRQEALDTMKQKFFPNVPKNFLLAQADTIVHKSYIEEFKFYPSPDSGDIDHGYVSHWSFTYEAKRTKNGL